jgi:hypothetical protein
MAVATTPVAGWDQRALIAEEATLGTTPNPAGSQGIAIESADMGPADVGVVRPLRDRREGRGMQAGFVEGRVAPIPFTLNLSQKSRAAAATVPVEAPLFKNAGLTQTVGATVVYTVASNPTIPGLSLYVVQGAGLEAAYAEQGYGGVVKSLEWSMGERELALKVGGAWMGKEHLGQSLSGTLIDASDTTLALNTAADAYRMGLGWYLIETEAVKVTAWDYTTGIGTCTRGQLSTSAAAHAAQPVRPYVPTMAIPSGSPIAETNLTVTLDGVTLRCTTANIQYATGIDHLPGESGSRRVQGTKAVRADVKVTLGLVLTMAEVAWVGKARQRKAVALTIAAGTGTGGVVTFSVPFAEVVAPVTPMPDNDVSVVNLELRARDSVGSDLFSFTLS